MKVLTINQPWASLIVLGEKKIETRSWSTKYRGALLIHSGSTINGSVCLIHPFKKVLDKYFQRLIDMPTGMIIAKCNLVDCIRILSEDGLTAKLENNFIVEKNEYNLGNYTPGRYAWILKDIEVLSKPKFVKGKLGVWNYDDFN
ncbi:ASCH domain-containing protein [Clostridium sp.]|uniref:ASCH domain-containing protein n=1 Tax=Clostridium sp. TaxID=1506 RepID=UPI002FDC9260